MTARILIVEDEAPIRDGLEALFAGQGFAVTGVADGRLALEALARETFDIVLLDLMIPGATGLEVLRAMRARGDATCVLVLTAMGAEDDVVLGLEAGADDYVTKPFGVRELVARIRGLLRRPRPEGRARPLVFGTVSLDVAALALRHPAGTLRLSAREVALLTYLATHADRVVPREELLVEVWGYRDGSIRTRTVDVHVQQLRAKLRDVPGGEALIATSRGVGYRFEGPGS